MKANKNDIILICAFAFLVIAIIITSLVGYFSLKKTNALFDKTYYQAYAQLVETERMNADLIAVHRAMKDVVLSKTEEQLAKALDQVSQYDAQVSEHFAALSQFNSGNQLLNDVIREYENWEPIRANTVSLARSGQYEAAAENTRTAGVAQVNLIYSKMKLLVASAQDEANIAYQTSNDISNKARFYLFWLTAFAIILSAAISILVSKIIRKYQDMLYEQNNELQITFDSIGDGVITTDTNRNILMLNKVAEKYTGWTSEEAFGKPFSEVFKITNEYTGENAKNPVAEVLDKDIICELENHTILTSKDGLLRYIADSAAPIKDQTGNTSGVVMIFRDVTERKQFQKALLDSEEHYRMLYTSMLNGYAYHEMIFDEHGVPVDYWFVDINPAFEKMTGLTKEMAVGKTIKELVPDTESYWIETYGKVVLTGEPIKYENYSEAFKKYFEVYAFSPIENHFAVLVADITERKQIEKELNNSRVLLDASIESAKEYIIYSIDTNYNYLYYNKNLISILEKLYHVNVEVGMNILESIASEPDRHQLKQNLERALAGESHIVIEKFGIRERNYYETSYNPIYNENNEIIGATGFSKDISDRKKREEEILYLNYHDILTGLYNRAYFENEKIRLDVDENLPLSIIWGDINGLKLINDGFGHTTGDRLLVEISKILRDCTKEHDIVARIGGDEFAILLPKTNAEEVQEVCRCIYKTCEEYEGKGVNKIYNTSISLGCATKIKPSEALEVISNHAEEVMYRRKLLDGKSMHSALLNSIRRTMIEKSHETEEHAQRLINLSRPIGKALCLPDEQMNELELLSTLHDIGKMSIGDNILNKPSSLNDDEWLQMKKHPEVGYRIALATAELTPIADYILTHHERWDGKGYPQGLAGENIPLLSRILSIADAYDAMTNDRPYRKAMEVEDAMIEIEKNAGAQFDPHIVALFMQEKQKEDALHTYDTNKSHV